MEEVTQQQLEATVRMILSETKRENAVLIQKLAEKHKDMIIDSIAAHTKSCPHGQKFRNYIWLMIGIGAGSGLISGGLGFAFNAIIQAV